MKKIILSILALFISALAYRQNTWKARIVESETKLPIVGATIILKGTKNSTSSDEKGLVTLTNIADGPQNIAISFVGFEEKTIALKFPIVQTVVEDIV